MRVAVIGHVEWTRFARVPRHPARGEITHAQEDWEQAGGGGGVAAVQLALLAEETHLFTAFGDDELGRRAQAELEGRGVVVHAASDRRPTRWAFTTLDEAGERTITTVGPQLRPAGDDDVLPWYELATMDAVLFVSGDVAALRWARKARVLVASARELDVLGRGQVQLDAIVGSGEDDAERYHAADLDPEPHLAVTTSGALGGWMQPGGPFTATPLPGPREDAYGCGDSFAAGLAYALGMGANPHDAVRFAARCGAAAMTGRGVAPQRVEL